MKSLEAKHIKFAYNTNEVINDVSLSLQEGEFLGIIGPNGAGKSTILRILCGVLRPVHGSVYVLGSEIGKTKPKKLAQDIGFVPQETHFSLDFSVGDVVLMGRYPYLKPFQKEARYDHQMCEQALEQAEITALSQRPINSLSSGERQRAVIARALAQEPKILLLDEPTSHLDLHHQLTIMNLLKKLNSQGISIITVNHDLNLASLYCHNLCLMHQGMIYAAGKPQNIITEKILKEVYGANVKVINHPDKSVPQVLLD